jgi:hypothetical protein
MVCINLSSLQYEIIRGIMQEIIIDGNSLSLEAVAQVAYQKAPIRLAEGSIEKVKLCREYVDRVIANGIQSMGSPPGLENSAPLASLRITLPNCRQT